jgi:hypothetical protein
LSLLVEVVVVVHMLVVVVQVELGLVVDIQLVQILRLLLSLEQEVHRVLPQLPHNHQMVQIQYLAQSQQQVVVLVQQDEAIMVV